MMIISRFNKAISKVNLNKIKPYQYLTILGGVILFSSWVIEKNIKQNWTEAKELHFEKTINSSFRQVQRLNAETIYYEAIRKEKIDSGQVAFYQVAIIDIYLGLMNSYYSEQEKINEDYDKFINNKKRILNEVQQTLNKGNFNKINNYYNEVETVFRNNFESLKRKHQVYYNNIIKEESKWNNIFIWLYCIGSILIGIGYLKNILSTNN